jgi:hypothetical protein
MIQPSRRFATQLYFLATIVTEVSTQRVGGAAPGAGYGGGRLLAAANGKDDADDPGDNRDADDGQDDDLWGAKVQHSCSFHKSRLHCDERKLTGMVMLNA